MILIIDSGSTKSDWILLKDSEILKAFNTIGFNPFFHDVATIANAIKQHNEIIEIAPQIKAIHYYGAGCSSTELNQIVKNAFATIFTNAVINVDHDLAASAYATYNGQPAIACILGTGSNSCYFNGNEITQEVPSLAYILGDEGSGNYYGKKLLRAYLYKQLPSHIHEDFKNQYNLDKHQIFENTYWKPFANVYLASFMEFIYDRKSDPYFQKIIIKGMNEFMSIHVCSFENYDKVPVHFVGSIAHFFEAELKTAAKELNINVGQIIRKPIRGLVNYHIDDNN